MHNINIKTTRELRNNFAAVQLLLDNHDQVVITRNGKGAAVLINFDDYQKYEQYLHESYIRKGLSLAKQEISKPDARLIEHEQVWSQIEQDFGKNE